MPEKRDGGARRKAGNINEWGRRNRELRTQEGFQIGHIVDKSVGGSDDPANLRALCPVCNEGARNLTLDRASLQKLLIQVRRATGADQVELLAWLVKKSPRQAAELLPPRKGS